MEESYSVEVNATKAQVEEFKESVLWQDICRELDFWAAEVIREGKSLAGHVMDGNLNTGAALTLLGYTEGRKEAVARFKIILEILLNHLEEKENDSRLNKTD